MSYCNYSDRMKCKRTGSSPDVILWYADDGFTVNMPPSTIPARMEPAQPTAPQTMTSNYGQTQSQYPIGMGYVPIQSWQQPYPVEQAISRGTIFSDLDLPFMMGGCI